MLHVVPTVAADRGVERSAHSRRGAGAGAVAGAGAGAGAVARGYSDVGERAGGVQRRARLARLALGGQHDGGGELVWAAGARAGLVAMLGRVEGD